MLDAGRRPTNPGAGSEIGPKCVEAGFSDSGSIRSSSNESSFKAGAIHLRAACERPPRVPGPREANAPASPWRPQARRFLRRANQKLHSSPGKTAVVQTHLGSLFHSAATCKLLRRCLLRLYFQTLTRILRRSFLYRRFRAFGRAWFFIAARSAPMPRRSARLRMPTSTAIFGDASSRITLSLGATAAIKEKPRLRRHALCQLTL